MTPPKQKGSLRVLALDPATNCGWAHSCGAAGTWDLSIRRDESSGMRVLRLAGKLNEIRETVGVDVLIFEAARHAAPGTQGALVVQAELQGVIKLWAESAGIEFRGVSPSEVKKLATGKGNTGKDKVIAAAKARWPEFNGDDNEADARWILELARRDLGIL